MLECATKAASMCHAKFLGSSVSKQNILLLVATAKFNSLANLLQSYSEDLLVQADKKLMPNSTLEHFYLCINMIFIAKE